MKRFFSQNVNKLLLDWLEKVSIHSAITIVIKQLLLTENSTLGSICGKQYTCDIYGVESTV